jgi:hypothetical protein
MISLQHSIIKCTTYLHRVWVGTIKHSTQRFHIMCVSRDSTLFYPTFQLMSNENIVLQERTLMWILLEKYCTVKTHTECQTIVQNIVSRFWQGHNIETIVWCLICEYLVLKFDQEMYYHLLYFRTKPISTVSIIITHTNACCL